MNRNPMQPMINDNDVVRFKANAIVCYLLDKGGIDINHLASTLDKFSQDDWEQFFQLIGYSLCGFHELSRVSDQTCFEASKAAGSTGCRDHGCGIHLGVKRTL